MRHETSVLTPRTQSFAARREELRAPGLPFVVRPPRKTRGAERRQAHPTMPRLATWPRAADKFTQSAQTKRTARSPLGAPLAAIALTSREMRTGIGPRFAGHLRHRQRAPRSRLIVARRAEPRRRPGAVRARHGAQAPHQTEASRPRSSTGVGGRKLKPQGRISGPNPNGRRARPVSACHRLRAGISVDPLHLKTPHEAPLVERGVGKVGGNRNKVKRTGKWVRPPKRGRESCIKSRFLHRKNVARLTGLSMADATLPRLSMFFRIPHGERLVSQLTLNPH